MKARDDQKKKITMQDNVRRFKRYPIESLKIKGRMVLASTVDIIDISLSGISLKLDRRLNIGNDYALKIERNGISISVKGTVVWAALHESRRSKNNVLVPIYSIGMKFNDISKEKISELITFIESHTVEKLAPRHVHRPTGLRFHMRFHVDSSGKAILTCAENYKVREISMGGMRIESGNVLKVEEQVSMEIALPDNNQISFLGRIVTCIPIKDTETELYAVGIEFLNMPEDNGRQLEQFISVLR